jgi:metabotropic X receptor
MKAVKRRNATGMFSWIGSDGWGGRGLAYHGKEQQVNMFLFLKIDGIR